MGWGSGLGELIHERTRMDQRFLRVGTMGVDQPGWYVSTCEMIGKK